MYFVVNKVTNKILSHYIDKPSFEFDSAMVVEVNNITINESVIDWGYGSTSIQYSYTPDTVDLVAIKTAAISEVVNKPYEPIEITLANGLKFDDNEATINYLNSKKLTSNVSETIFDKNYNSAVMTNSQLTTAIQTVAVSLMAKDDEIKNTIVEINNATTIDEVKTISGIYTEKQVKLIVDVDGTEFDDVNQVTNESLNQVVFPKSGLLDISTISWINGVSIKSINNQSSPIDVRDSNNVLAARLTYLSNSPIINGAVIANALPVELNMIVYCN